MSGHQSENRRLKGEGAWHRVGGPQMPLLRKLVVIGWLPNWPTLEHEELSRWLGDRWENNWTPTHWRYVKP